MKKIITKANKKCTHQNIAYVYQEVLQYPPKKLWGNAANIIKTVLKLSCNQENKINHVFHCYEDAREMSKSYNGERNAFVRTNIRALETN
eukprot:8886057-Ditylum_brightwellii.AAC.1